MTISWMRSLKAFVWLAHLAGDGVNMRTIKRDQLATGGVGEEFLRAAGELVFASYDVLSKFRDRGKSVSIGLFAVNVRSNLNLHCRIEKWWQWWAIQDSNL